MTITVAPSTEACSALVNRINSGTGYPLRVLAEYAEQLVDELEDLNCLHVDVVPGDEETLVETLAVEDRTSHEIRIHIRQRVQQADQPTIDALKRTVRQIWQRVNNFDSSDGRVKVWECDNETKQTTDKALLNADGVFRASILLRVEVEPSA